MPRYVRDLAKKIRIRLFWFTKEEEEEEITTVSGIVLQEDDRRCGMSLHDVWLFGCMKKKGCPFEIRFFFWAAKLGLYDIIGLFIPFGPRMGLYIWEITIEVDSTILYRLQK